MKISEIYNENISWKDMSTGGMILGGGTSKEFNTGEWRVGKPIFNSDKCSQCLLCVPLCPDSSIPVENKKRLDFDYNHCKGCGICVKNCPVGAIKMLKGE